MNAQADRREFSPATNADIANAIAPCTPAASGVSAQVADAIAQHSEAFNAWLEHSIDNSRPGQDEEDASQALADEWSKAEFWLLQIIPRSLADVVAIAKHILPHQQRDHLQEDALPDWLKALALARTSEPKNESGEDPIHSLIALHRSQFEAAGEEGLDDEELTRRIEACSSTWWQLFDSELITVAGAIAYAEYVVEADEAERAPDMRVKGDERSVVNLTAGALLRVRAFLKDSCL